MPKFITDIYNSFFNSKEGMSARKLTAFTLVGCIVFIHIMFVTAENAIEALWFDGTLASLMLGIITVQNIIELRSGISVTRESSEKKEGAKNEA